MHTRLRKAVFPVAGLGSRFLPVTKASPKEMLPIVDKPLIQYAVEEAAAAGITEMIFVTGRHKRAIEDHFDKAYELETETERMDGDIARIHSIVEKPRPADAPSNLAVIGRYVLTPRIFDLLGELTPGAGGEIQLTDAISQLLSHERVLAVRLPGRRFDCGSKLGYLQATVEFGSRHSEVGEAFARYLESR